MDRKNIPNPGFAEDDGTADPALAAALVAWQQDPSAEPDLLAALTPSRLMVPIVALLGEVEVDEHGHQHEKTSDMAVPVLEAADGRRALPAFTSLATMTRWRADARPAPVVAPQAAMVAYSERADTLLIDPAGPVSYRLSGARLRAVAENRPYLPPHLDPEVHRALRQLLAAVPEIAAAHLAPATDADATLALVLTDPGADPRPLATHLGPALAADPTLRLRLDQGLQLAFLAEQLDQQPFYLRP
ncbi:SseB family protein [Streptomyces sp. TLI_171]|uniref:SseB family protein n=1 Tax=Streptomyces sp. TLI_171 TaxID=1938859 RepID=UPI000C175571|nr:SseB family protein [Streptomyces sp. TLI_171]RKE22843.1 type III secretion system (T3SS) SseB-like protein [Streptomyces sp. TLI_171]